MKYQRNNIQSIYCILSHIILSHSQWMTKLKLN